MDFKARHASVLHSKLAIYHYITKKKDSKFIFLYLFYVIQYKKRPSSACIFGYFV